MNNKKITTIIILLLILIFTACSSKNTSLIEEKNLNAVSNEEVTIKAIKADAYRWSQISGIEVILINADTNTLTFIAPEVQTEETLVFEVEALIASLVGSDLIKKERATVTVFPLEITTENNETNQTTISLKSITLTIDKISLNLDENTTLNAVALYSDNTTKDITDEVEWINTDSNAVQISKHNLITKQEKNIILQAKRNAVTSNAVALEIYQEINGHKLPPQPDETLNNSTLLGIDTNKNGVRDDVERWIFDEYKEPIVQAVAMQNARAFGKILVDPSKARETKKFTSDLIDCESYYTYQDSRHLIPKRKSLHKESRPLILNTRERSRAYYEYNQALSGGVYSLRDRNTHKSRCDFNETKIERGEW